MSYTDQTATNLPTLADLRQWLRFPVNYTTDDELLTNTILPAAIAAAKAECGDIVPTRHNENYDGGDMSIWLRHKPVLSVEAVTEDWGFTSYQLDEIEVGAETTSNMFCFSLDLPESGLITRRSGGNIGIPFVGVIENGINVIYTSGRDYCPPLVRQFIMALSGIWYQSFEQRMVESASQYSVNTPEGTDAFARSQAISSIYFGVPSGLIEMLKDNRKPPIIG